MKEELEREFQELQKFVSFFLDYFFKSVPKTTSSTAADQPKEKVTRRQWLEGHRQAASDFVEMSDEMQPAEIARLDAELRSRGIVTLSEMRRRYSRAYKRIVKRGAIKNDTEFYIINGVLSDLESGISEEERQQLGALISQYENKIRGTHPA